LVEKRAGDKKRAGAIWTMFAISVPGKQKAATSGRFLSVE